MCRIGSFTSSDGLQKLASLTVVLVSFFSIFGNDMDDNISIGLKAFVFLELLAHFRLDKSGAKIDR